MSSRRLCKSDYRLIKNNLVKHAFADQREKLEQRKVELGCRIYNQIYTPEIQQAMLALPDNFLPVTDKIEFRERGESCWRSLPLGEYKREPIYGKAIELPPEMSAEWRELLKEESALKEAVESAECQAAATLTSFRTVKSLLAGWPEVAPFIPDYLLSDENKKLPAVPVTELNQVFKLPKDEPAAEETKEVA